MTQKVSPLVRKGFTIVELIIIIIVLGILASIVVITMTNVQRQAQDNRTRVDIKTVQAKIETYQSENGLYPVTTENSNANWRTIDVRTDDTCFNGSSQSDWVPGIPKLPQSTPNNGTSAGVDGSAGCYLYASDGVKYVLSAWNMASEPSTDSSFYRRLGFREFQTGTSTQFYTCNENVIGGRNGGYNIDNDYYKHSYTVSNITDCDETPPPGA